MNKANLFYIVIFFLLMGVILSYQNCGKNNLPGKSSKEVVVKGPGEDTIHLQQSNQGRLKQRPVVSFFPRLDLSILAINSVKGGEKYQISLFKQVKGKLPQKLITKKMEKQGESHVAVISKDEVSTFDEKLNLNQSDEATNSFLLITEFYLHNQKYEVYDEVIYRKICHTRLIKCDYFKWGLGESIAFKKDPSQNHFNCPHDHDHTSHSSDIHNLQPEGTFALVSSGGALTAAKGLKSFVDELSQMAQGVPRESLQELGEKIVALESKHGVRVKIPQADSPRVLPSRYDYDTAIKDYDTVDQFKKYLNGMEEAFDAMKASDVPIPRSKGKDHLDVYLVRDVNKGSGKIAGTHSKSTGDLVLDASDPGNNAMHATLHESGHAVENSLPLDQKTEFRTVINNLTSESGQLYKANGADSSQHFVSPYAGTLLAEDVAENFAHAIMKGGDNTGLSSFAKNKMDATTAMAQGKFRSRLDTPEYKLQIRDSQEALAEETARIKRASEEKLAKLDADVKSGKKSADEADMDRADIRDDEFDEIYDLQQLNKADLARASFDTTAPITPIAPSKTQSQLARIEKTLGIGAVGVGAASMVLGSGSAEAAESRNEQALKDIPDRVDPESNGVFASAYRYWDKVKETSTDKGMQNLASTMQFFLEGPKMLDNAANTLGHTVNEIDHLKQQLDEEGATPEVKALMEMSSNMALIKDVGAVVGAAGLTAVEFLPGGGPTLKALKNSKPVMNALKTIPGALELIDSDQSGQKGTQNGIADRPTMCSGGVCSGSKIADTISPVNQQLKEKLRELAANPDVIEAAAKAATEGIQVAPTIRPVSQEEIQKAIQMTPEAKEGDTIVLTAEELSTLNSLRNPAPSPKTPVKNEENNPNPDDQSQIQAPNACMLNLMEEQDEQNHSGCN